MNRCIRWHGRRESRDPVTGVERVTRLVEFERPFRVGSHGSTYVLLSHIDRAFDSGAPETMAFLASGSGRVRDWTELASNWSDDPELGFDDLVRQLEAM